MPWPSSAAPEKRVGDTETSVSPKPWTTASPPASSAAWPCIATIVYARAIATSYGGVRLQIPVLRCGQCRRMAGGMTLLGR